jgi:3-hydroxymyristoyl/3-hydroxydecanoyl-(acyl carrier protein) dehydratase
MQTHSSAEIIENYLHWWQEHTRQVGLIHDRFLELRRAELRQKAAGIELLVASYHPPSSGPGHPLLTIDDLSEFATGSVVKCLGPEYAVYAGRRSPRIPNSELLLMSRVLSIQGQKGEFDLASGIVVEYDVPAEAWYLEDEKDGQMPYSICIEVALQPCGVLSAYLGTPLRFPEVDYYFRNLDGETILHRLMDVRGKTIQARAELLKTIFYGATIIQHFSFELACDREVFFRGKSSFGYFSAEAMAGQAGLDGGKTVLPWLKGSGQESRLLSIEATSLQAGVPKGKLHLIDRAVILPGAVNHPGGYVYASRRNLPGDWFYACHFKEDPVMPGSLGIEAILQAMKVFARQQTNRSAPAVLLTGQKMNWRYRGQVLQHHRQMQLEVHFQKSQSAGKTRLFSGDASLWADDARIYEVRNLAIAVEEEPA